MCILLEILAEFLTRLKKWDFRLFCTLKEVEQYCFLQPKIYWDCSDESIHYCCHIKSKQKILRIKCSHICFDCDITDRIFGYQVNIYYIGVHWNVLLQSSMASSFYLYPKLKKALQQVQAIQASATWTL